MEVYCVCNPDDTTVAHAVVIAAISAIIYLEIAATQEGSIEIKASLMQQISRLSAI
jgi:spore coat protein CotF